MIIYSDEMLHFEDRNSLFENVEDRLLCSKCYKVMFDACQTICGCRLCRECIFEKSVCPTCSHSPVTYYTDCSIAKEILGLNCKCIYKECSENKKLKDILEHILVCKYREERVVCPIVGCRKFLNKNTIDAHVDPHTLLLLTEIKNNKIIHEREIEKYKVLHENEIKQLKFIIDKLKMPKQGSTWELPNIRDRILNARLDGGLKEIISPPFYVSPGGYKMAYKIFFNGDGQGKGRYLSVYFVICKGEFDDNLTWPFKSNIEIKMWQQSQLGECIVARMKPDDNRKVYRKPEKEKYNTAAGQPLFLNLDEFIQSDCFACNGTVIFEMKVTD